jgi:hypothetical protein
VECTHLRQLITQPLVKRVAFIPWASGGAGKHLVSGTRLLLRPLPRCQSVYVVGSLCAPCQPQFSVFNLCYSAVPLPVMAASSRPCDSFRLHLHRPLTSHSFHTLSHIPRLLHTSVSLIRFTSPASSHSGNVSCLIVVCHGHPAGHNTLPLALCDMVIQCSELQYFFMSCHALAGHSVLPCSGQGFQWTMILLHSCCAP